MEDIEKKLDNFEKSCYALASEQKNDLEEKFALKVKESIEEELKEYRQKLEKKKKNAFNRMEKEFNSNVWKLENDCKKRLIEKEEELDKQLFESLCEEMKQFTYKDEYLEFLINSITNAMNKIENKNEIIVYITKNDKDRFESELKRFSNNIEIIDDYYIGGCIIKNNNEIIDNTILMNLKERIHEREKNI